MSWFWVVLNIVEVRFPVAQLFHHDWLHMSLLGRVLSKEPCPVWMQVFAGMCDDHTLCFHKHFGALLSLIEHFSLLSHFLVNWRALSSWLTSNRGILHFAIVSDGWVLNFAASMGAWCCGWIATSWLGHVAWVSLLLHEGLEHVVCWVFFLRLGDSSEGVCVGIVHGRAVVLSMRGQWFDGSVDVATVARWHSRSSTHIEHVLRFFLEGICGFVHLICKF